MLLFCLRLVAAAGAHGLCDIDIQSEVCLLQLRSKDTIHTDGLKKFREESSTDAFEQESEVDSNFESTASSGVVDFESGSLTSGGLTFTKDGTLGQQPTTYAAASDS